MSLLLLDASTKPLADSRVFWLGVAGGLLALLITQILPAAVAVFKAGIGPSLTAWRVAAAVVIVGSFGAAGGGAALLMGDVTKAKQAILYGIAWQAILGGAIKTGKAALP